MYVTMTVRGVKRNVSVEKYLQDGSIRGKVRINGKTVRGLIKTNSVGAKKFIATGSNSGLL